MGEKAWHLGLEGKVCIAVFMNERFFLDVSQTPDHQQPHGCEQNANDRAKDERPTERPENIADHERVADDCIQPICPKRLAAIWRGQGDDPSDRRPNEQTDGLDNSADPGKDEWADKRYAGLGNKRQWKYLSLPIIAP